MSRQPMGLGRRPLIDPATRENVRRLCAAQMKVIGRATLTCTVDNLDERDRPPILRAFQRTPSQLAPSG